MLKTDSDIIIRRTSTALKSTANVIKYVLLKKAHFAATAAKYNFANLTGNTKLLVRGRQFKKYCLFILSTYYICVCENCCNLIIR